MHLRCWQQGPCQVFDPWIPIFQALWVLRSASLPFFSCGQFSNKGSGNSLEIINHTDGWEIKRVPLLLQMWFYTFLHIFKLNQKSRCKIRVLTYIMSLCDIPWRNAGLRETWPGCKLALKVQVSTAENKGEEFGKVRVWFHCCVYVSLSD